VHLCGACIYTGLRLTERQTPPGFSAVLTLQPDCYSTTFPTPSSDQVSLLVGQPGNFVPCMYVSSSGPDSLGLLEIEYQCVPPGATLSEANCESAAISGLQTLQTNPAVQTIISTAQGIDKGINRVISWLPNKIGGSIGPVDMSWVVQQAVSNFVNKVTPQGLSGPLNAISVVDKMGTQIDKMTPTDAASACGGLSNALYNIYLEFTQNSIGPSMQQLASFNLASTTFIMIQAPLWVNPSYQEVQARCWKTGTGKFNSGTQCPATPVCSTGSCLLATQQCTSSLCCTRGTSYCVNPATCAAS
jgi:hypothetical protein